MREKQIPSSCLGASDKGIQSPLTYSFCVWRGSPGQLTKMYWTSNGTPLLSVSLVQKSPICSLVISLPYFQKPTLGITPQYTLSYRLSTSVLAKKLTSQSPGSSYPLTQGKIPSNASLMLCQYKLLPPLGSTLDSICSIRDILVLTSNL